MKVKDKFAIRLRPVLKHVKGLGKVIDNQLEKRTKPILDVLQYWQGLLALSSDIIFLMIVDILRTYGIQVELRKGGTTLKKKPINPRKLDKNLKKKSESNSSDSALASSNNSVNEGISRSGSMISLQSFSIRPPFLQRSASEVSVASSRSFFQQANSALQGKWELVVFTGFKRRSQAASLYSVNRRSTYSLHQTSDAKRPATVCMVGTEEIPSLSRPNTPRNRRSMSSSMSSSVNRRSRAKILSLEELAKLPLPTPSSPFSASEPSLPMCDPVPYPDSEQKQAGHDTKASTHKHKRSSSSSMIQWSYTTEEQQASARARHDSMTIPLKVNLPCSSDHGSGSVATADDPAKTKGEVGNATAPVHEETSNESIAVSDKHSRTQTNTGPVEIIVTEPADTKPPLAKASSSQKTTSQTNADLVPTFVRESSLSSSVGTNSDSSYHRRGSIVQRSPLATMSHTPESLKSGEPQRQSKFIRRSSSFVNLISAASTRLNKSFTNFGSAKDDSVLARTAIGSPSLVIGKNASSLAAFPDDAAAHYTANTASSLAASGPNPTSVPRTSPTETAMVLAEELLRKDHLNPSVDALIKEHKDLAN